MDIVKTLKALTLYTHDTEIKDLDKDKFFEFIRHLKSSKKVRFIYRGESNLTELYGVDTSNISLLQTYLFMIGEKGRAFCQKDCSRYGNVFEFIWDKFYNKVCKLRFDSSKTREKVRQFLDENSSIKDYFSNERNRGIFLENGKKHEKEQRAVADYYLALLHTIGKSGNARNHFLSSSTDISVANDFKCKNGIILYGWVPQKGLKDKIISYEDIGKCNDMIRGLKLPVYQTPIYLKQKEICLKCGLMPHFIIGFQHEDKFYINPNTLNSWEDNIVYDGLDINQKDFMDIFMKTNYKNLYIFLDGKYIIIDSENNTII